MLFRDEKYTVKHLRQYIKNCKFTGNPQVSLNLGICKSLFILLLLIAYPKHDYKDIHIQCGTLKSVITNTTYVVVRDQATCKNIQGGKHWSETEIDPMMCLQWANEVPGK